MMPFQQRLADPALRAAAIAELVAKPSREAPMTVSRAAESGDETFRISTSGLDRYNSTIDPKGWKLDQYLANPVVLWMHDMWSPPLARSKSVVADDSGLVAVAQWVDRAVYPLAGTVADMVRGGFLNAASVSWDADKYAYNEKRGGIDFLEQTLLEWSIVTVPGNADALVQRARAEGINMDPMREFAERVMRATGSKDAEALARGGAPPVRYVVVRGDLRVEAPTAKALGRAVKELGLTPGDNITVTQQRADAPDVADPVAEEESPEGAEQPAPTEGAAAAACACGLEYGDGDKFCAGCGQQRAEPAPTEDEPMDEARAAEALAILSRLTRS
jgi:HK97 family phage prohead protease